MPDRSVQVTNLLEWMNYVRSSLHIYSEQTREALHEAFQRFESMEKDDLARRYADYDAMLEQSAEALAKAEDAYVDEQGDQGEARTAHSLSSAKLTALFSELKIIVKMLSSDTERALGLDGQLPERAAERRAHVKHVLSLIAQRGDKQQGRLGQPIDLAYYREPLEEALAQNERDADALLSESRERESAMLKRDEALRRARTTYSYVASALFADMRCVGLTEIARRVRPTVRRAQGLDARTPEEEEDPISPAEPGLS